MAESRYFWEYYPELVSRRFLLPDNQPITGLTACRLRKQVPGCRQVDSRVPYHNNGHMPKGSMVWTAPLGEDEAPRGYPGIYSTPSARKCVAWASAKRASERRRSPFSASALRSQLSGSFGRRSIALFAAFNASS